MTLDQGMHLGVLAAVYHADPAPEPSLSSSLARRLLVATPRKVRTEHPRFAPQDTGSRSRTAEIGAVAHRLLLNAGAEIVVVSAEAWTKKEHQAARSEAYAAGSLPILAPDYAQAEAMADQARWSLSLHGIDPAAMQAETVLLWRDPLGCWCRAMLDMVLITPTSALVIDYKTTEQEIGPENVGRYICNQGYDVQEAFYRRGLTVLFPHLAGRIRFLFLVQDQAAPHDCLLAEPSGEMRHIADQKASVATALWARCMKNDDWPGHAASIVHAIPPPFVEHQWTERALNSAIIRALPHDPMISPIMDEARSLPELPA